MVSSLPPYKRPRPLPFQRIIHNKHKIRRNKTYASDKASIAASYTEDSGIKSRPGDRLS
jgi:hypothetical protein